MIDNAIKFLNNMNLICRDDEGVIRINQMFIDIRNNNTNVRDKTCGDG